MINMGFMESLDEYKWFEEKSSYKINSTDYSIIKDFLKFLKGCGFKREKKKDYIFHRWGITLNNIKSTPEITFYSKDDTLNEKDIVLYGNKTIFLKYNLNMNFQISCYDLTLCDIKVDGGNVLLKDIFEKLKKDIFSQKELKSIIRKNKISKLI